MQHGNLNGWQRLGIIASVLWFVVGGYVKRERDIDRAGAAMALSYRICWKADAAHQQFDFANCDGPMLKSWNLALQDSWPNVFLLATGPILLAWPTAYLLIGLGRWVKRGFGNGLDR